MKKKGVDSSPIVDENILANICALAQLTLENVSLNLAFMVIKFSLSQYRKPAGF